MYILGEILGYAAMLSGLAIFISVKRSRILSLKIMCDSLFLLHQLCRGMMSGAALYGVAVFRSLVFYHRGKKKWATTPLWLVIFILLTMISPILTWAGPISLLPAIGSVFCVFSYYTQNTMLLRILSIFGEGLWLLYGLFGGSIQVMLFGVIALISIAIGMINEWQHKRRKEKNPSLTHLD